MAGEIVSATLMNPWVQDQEAKEEARKRIEEKKQEKAEGELIMYACFAYSAFSALFFEVAVISENPILILGAIPINILGGENLKAGTEIRSIVDSLDESIKLEERYALN